MPPPNGTVNNPNGRPKGSQNKVTSDLKELVKDFLHTKQADFKEAFESLDPTEKVKAYTALLKYAIPTLQSTKEEIDFNDMSEAQLDYLIECLREGKKPISSEFKNLTNAD